MNERTNDLPEGQPSGIRIEKTLEVVNEMLTNPDFCEEVKDTYEWPMDMNSDRAALLFLTMRYQDLANIVALRTDTLRREVAGMENRVVNLEDRVFDPENLT